MIKARSVHIGTESYVSENADIEINGDFYLGDYSRLGDCVIRGNNIHFGNHFYHSSGLKVGGGGSQGPDANLWVGDRCVMHNNFINVCEPVVIGDDVGLSPEVSILTHGFWQNVLKGYPAKFEGVTIRSGVIVGYRSTILPGVHIGFDVTVGAESVVTKNIHGGSIVAGNPARVIGDVWESRKPTEDEKREMIGKIIAKYKRLAEFHDFYPDIKINYPEITITSYLRDFTINVETLEHRGKESKTTDHFRDFMRKFGIRIYTERPFG